MQAITKPEPSPGLVLSQVDVPDCGPSEVLIRVRHAGICGTDLHIANWDEWARSRIHPPLILGHEFAGEVVEIGKEAKAFFEKGQLVTAEGHIVCGHCHPCRMGQGHICRNTQIIGVDRNGAFAEYVAVPATNVMSLDLIPTSMGAVMDPMGNAFHAVLSAEIPGTTVLVLGCGPIGCFAVGIAKASGAAKIIAVDPNAYRLNLARRMGADVIINPAENDMHEVVRKETKEEGVDLVCEMSGHPKAFDDAVRCVRLGGRIHLLGLPSKAVPVHLFSDIIFKGLTIYGVIGRWMYKTWDQMRTFLSSGLLDPTPVITHTFPLCDVEGALKAIRSGEVGKIIFEVGRD